MAVSSRSADVDKRPSSGRIVARVIWTSIKILTIPLVCIIAIIVGLAIGYSVLGKQPLSDVFDIRTWKHMYDLVFAEGS
ncbi:MAG: DNA-directed RNA polymerase subunit beta [Candidatus Cohnella colombiensis]|uniref:DNA-directed RNA polymerase subunit beta n=1 Tax=Candidatus Cohnella colombiensis TaxID=3121368 RepID=A0AA95EWB8_9BACL|nr:MAG: DNA-directed RNA polymerase subunit beta [Cohnella sp.]